MLDDIASLTIRINEALDRIERCFPGPLRLYSCLAEGAHRLVAKQVLLRSNSGLCVPLPLPVEEYATDFASQGSRAEFFGLLAKATEVIQMTPQPARRQAYQEAGRFIIEHSRVLLAIWDGQRARGLGGTGQVIAMAREGGLPLAWIFARNGTPSEDPNDNPGLVYERFPDNYMDGPERLTRKAQ